MLAFEKSDKVEHFFQYEFRDVLNFLGYQFLFVHWFPHKQNSTLLVSHAIFESSYACRQTWTAVSTTNFSFCHCCSSVSRFTSMGDAKPHCGRMARFSSGTYLLASSTRRAS